MSDLVLFDSLTRSLRPFVPIDRANVRLYTCGPTVYNYQHIGNMRAFLFADTLARVLRWKGFPTTHVINITDVGHLTSDADAGDDKMERAAEREGRSIWEIAAHYTDAFKRDVARLGIVPPTRWAVATDHIGEMIAFAEQIVENGYTYPLTEKEAPSAAGLYFDVSKLPSYGQLARSNTEAAHEWITDGRIDHVEGKKHVADFALWRTTPPGERRQMEWESPWGRGAPGWHLECSVMSKKYLSDPFGGGNFDIHTGGIDHREIHHPNEIAQNQAHCACGDTGARWWMHNNFLVERGGKMSKSSGEFLTLQALVDRGFHPLAYRMMCLQAHYRSELEFSWESLLAASVRLKRLIRAVHQWKTGGPEHDDDTFVQGAHEESCVSLKLRFDAAISDDLGTPAALTVLDDILSRSGYVGETLSLVESVDEVLGLDLMTLSISDAHPDESQILRVEPITAALSTNAVRQRIAERKAARAEKDYPRSDAIRDELAAVGVEVMDGDPLGWDWKPTV